jgi:hypothetical protein
MACRLFVSVYAIPYILEQYSKLFVMVLERSLYCFVPDDRFNSPFDGQTIGFVLLCIRVMSGSDGKFALLMAAGGIIYSPRLQPCTETKVDSRNIFVCVIAYRDEPCFLTYSIYTVFFFYDLTEACQYTLTTFMKRHCRSVNRISKMNGLALQICGTRAP